MHYEFFFNLALPQKNAIMMKRSLFKNIKKHVPWHRKMKKLGAPDYKTLTPL